MKCLLVNKPTGQDPCIMTSTVDVEGNVIHGLDITNRRSKGQLTGVYCSRFYK